jgi:hypothetical protein
MSASQIALLSVSEAIAAIFIVRLWRRGLKRGMLAKIFWSAILLIPVLGLIAYGFCAVNPDEHPYDTDTTSGSAETFSTGEDHSNL